MPHTISPNPSSQGLGISFSTMSPPPAESPVPRFTGIVPQSSQPSPTRLPPAGQYGRPQPSPTRAGQPLWQPAFQLRATHTRNGSTSGKGYATFSAIPAQASRPMGPRASNTQSPKIGGPSTRSDTDHSQIPSLGIDPEYADEGDDRYSEAGTEAAAEIEEETPKQSLRPLPTPSRSASMASHLTTASKTISEDLRRKFSKSSNVGTLEGGSGKYLPLSGEDDVGDEADHDQDVGHTAFIEPSSTQVEVSPMPLPIPHPRRPSVGRTINSPPSHSAVASGAMQASPSRLSAEANQASSSDHSYSTFQTRQFPYSPSNNHPPGSATTYSDPTNSNSYAYQQYQPRPQQFPLAQNHRMARSRSQPQYLYGVPELESNVPGPSQPTSRPEPIKRSSEISAGIHSKNAVLLSAENGGMMLAFSPTGDGTFRPGELICGSGTGILASAQSPPSVGSNQDELRARPWSESSMSHDHDNALGRKPTMLGRRGRSLSDGAQLLARQGTLLHPQSSKQRSSAELNVLLGGPKSRRLSSNKLLPPPPTEEVQDDGAWQKDNKVRLEASKKGKARVEVDVVLERECVVEGGEVRGRMEVRISGGKRGEGLRVGAGKVRVVGFEELSGTTRHIFYHQPHPLPVFDPSIQHNLSSSLFASGPDSDGYRLAAEGTHNIPFRMRLPLGGGAKGTYTSQNGKGPCVRYVVVGSVKIHIPSTGKRSIAHFYRSIVVLPYLNPSVVLAPSSEPVEGYTERGLGWNLTGEKGRVELRVSLGRRVWVSGQRLWCEVAIRNDSNRKIKTLNLALLQTIQVFNPQPLLDTANLPSRIIGKRKSLSNCMGTDNNPSTPDLDACQTTTQRRKISEEMIEADFISHGAGRVTGKGWWTGVDSGESGHWDLSLQIPPGMLSIRRTRLIEVQYTLRVTVNGSIYVDVPVQLINFLSIDPPPMPRDGPGLLNPPVSNKQSIGHDRDQKLQVTIKESGGVYQQPGPVHSRPGAIRSDSDFSLDSVVGAARASSTTLHIDALLQAGRLKAEAEAMGHLPPALIGMGMQNRTGKSSSSRPLSLGSSYSISQRDHNTLSHIRTKSNPMLRPKGARAISYGSATVQTDSQSIFSANETEENETSEEDKIKVAARRALGRQKSLAMINLELDIEKQQYLQHEEPLSPGRQPDTPLQGEYRPCHTPSEEVYEMVGSTPEEGSPERASDHLPVELDLESPVEETQPRTLRVVNIDEDAEDEDVESGPARSDREPELAEATQAARSPIEKLQGKLENLDHDDRDAEDSNTLDLDVGDETILADMVPEERQELKEVMSQQGHDPDHIPIVSNSYDYGEDNEYEPETEVNEDDQEQEQLISPVTPKSPIRTQMTTSTSLGRLPFLSSAHDAGREAHIAATRTMYGSIAADSAVSGISEQESEVGQVLEAVKRNVSIKVPSKLLPMSPTVGKETHEPDLCDDEPELRPAEKGINEGTASPTGTPRSTSISHSLLADARRNSQLDNGRTGSPSNPRMNGKAPAMVPSASSMTLRRESSNMGTTGHQSPSSTLRRESTASPKPGSARVIHKKSSFTFATPGSPLKVKSQSSGPLSMAHSPVKGPLSPGLSPKSLSVPKVSEMSRAPSLNSRLRNLVVPSDSSGSGSGENEHENGGRSDRTQSPTRSPDLESGDEGGIPGLAPSVASDSASSEGHQLDSPISMNALPQPMIQYPSISPNLASMPVKRLPHAPGGIYQPFLMEDPYGQKQMISNPEWRSSDYLESSQQVYNVQSQRLPIQEDRQDSLRIPMEELSMSGHGHLSTPSSPTSSCHSILPSVKNKILQMESREEALRKFSVSGSVAGSGSVPQSRQGSFADGPPSISAIQSRQHSLVGSQISRQPSLLGKQISRQPSLLGNGSRRPSVNAIANQSRQPSIPTTKTSNPISPIQRKSYTTALAPRPKRSTSDDSYYSHSQHNDDLVDQTPIGYRYDVPMNSTRVSTEQRAYKIGQGIGHTTFINRKSYAFSPKDQTLFQGSSVIGEPQEGYAAYQSESVNSRISTQSNSNSGVGVKATVGSLSKPAPKLDPFGLGFGSGSIITSPTSTSDSVQRNESVRSNSSNITEYDSAFMGNSPRRNYTSEFVRGGEGQAKVQEQGRTVKPKSSGYWDSGEGHGLKAFSDTVSPRAMRVSVSEGESSESEGLL
ncbi:uncharacterized protein I303_100866 [Kwoniella dejecticola CBS 10117]|uniref:Arrestin C-terminal-like domain-containing protein n=1 Tax=Kwoniella dejecticola CBS 10117 TaxID=1296121 RepID=A0A1A6AG44_9TREE|nr:uncharacterized protein I303_00869 [Kwoniella dejecticola CBS 10117]OBR89047.1 hypothetical protein I303_00869 [Kwoniella dejecticola CBS 10117]